VLEKTRFDIVSQALSVRQEEVRMYIDDAFSLNASQILEAAA